MASYLTACLLIALVISASAITVPPTPVSGNIISTVQEMQQARYFTFVMLIKMVQEKILQNTTFLMPNDRLLSTALIPENQVLEFLLGHSIPAPLLFNDLKHLPNGTIIPTHRLNYMITVTNKEHEKFYLNNVELVNPDICNVGDSFRCHGINGVLRPTTRRAKGSSCPHYASPPAAAPEPASSASQPLDPSSLPSPNTGPALSPAMEPTAESPQNSATSSLQFRGFYTALVLVLLFLFI